VQAGRAGTACRAPTAIRAVCIDLSEESIGAEDQAQRQSGDCDFSESAYDERAKTLLTHVAYIGAQADACEREQKGPARKIREAGELVFAENVGCGDGRNEQEAEDEFRKLVPEECGLVAHAGGFFLVRPVNRVT